MTKIDPLLSLIRHAETTGKYDVAFAFNRPNHKPLDKMTVDEVRAYQEGLADGDVASTAVGAYQIIRKTMAGLVIDLGLKGSEVFNAKLQDRMAVELLNRRGLDRYLSGHIAPEQFAHAVSKEWASFPNAIGVGRGGRQLPAEASFYSGDGLNQAHVSTGEVFAALPAPEVAHA